MSMPEKPSAPQDAERWLLEADDLIKRGQHQEALTLIEKVYDTSPSPRVLGNAAALKSIALRKLGRMHEALAAASAAAAASPGGPLPQIELAIMLRELGRLDEALVASKKAMELVPHDPDVWKIHAHLLMRAGRTADALDAVEHVLAVDSTDSGWWHTKGVALSHLARHTDAIAAYDKALRLEAEGSPTRVGILVNRARALAESQRYDEALREAELIRQLDPSEPGGWEVAGASLMQLQRFEEALAALDQLIAFRPNSVPGWRNKGTTLYSLNRLGEALDAYDRALALSPEDDTVHRLRSEVIAVLASEGRLPPRVDLAAEPELRVAAPWLQAARWLRKSKRYDEALAACDQAIARAPGDLEPVTVKFVILRNRLRWREAFPVLRELSHLRTQQWLERHQQAGHDRS